MSDYVIECFVTDSGRYGRQQTSNLLRTVNMENEEVTILSDGSYVVARIVFGGKEGLIQNKRVQGVMICL